MIEIKSSEPNIIIRKNNEELRKRLSSISFIRQILLMMLMKMNIRGLF